MKIFEYQPTIPRAVRPDTYATWRGRSLKQKLTEWLVTPFRSEL